MAIITMLTCINLTVFATEKPNISIEISGYNSPNNYGLKYDSTIKTGNGKISAQSNEKIAVSFILSDISKISTIQLYLTYNADYLAAGYYIKAESGYIWCDESTKQSSSTIIENINTLNGNNWVDDFSYTYQNKLYIAGSSSNGEPAEANNTVFSNGYSADGLVVATVGFNVINDIENIYDMFIWNDDITNISADENIDYTFADGAISVSCRHNYYKSTNNATCTVSGNNTYICNICGYTYSEEIPAYGYHRWDNGTITKEATCAANGEIRYKCTVCGETMTMPISKTDHTIIADKAVAPTCTLDGLTAGSHCSVCSTVITAQQTIAATGHCYKDGVCTICGDVNSELSNIPLLQTNSYTSQASNYTLQPNTAAVTKAEKTTAKPKKTTIKKLTAGKKLFKVSWKKISGVSGYQIQYSTSKKFTKKKTKTITIKSNKSKSPSKTIKKLKSSKKYYVRIRTYKTVNGKKVCSNWSAVKNIKTKK